MEIATKEQERKALEKIRNIIAGLGEGSYIGIAFEGCLEDAEQNIENDFGCSMKQRFESEEKKANEMEQTLISNAEEIRANHQEIADLVEEVESLKAQLQVEKKKRIDENTFKRVWLLADDEVDKANEEIMEAAATIAEGGCDTEYEQAISGMAGLFNRKKDLEDLVRCLDKIGEELGYF